MHQLWQTGQDKAGPLKPRLPHKEIAMSLLNRISAELTKLNIKHEVLASDCPELEDDEISLSKSAHIQVGENYAMLVECKKGAFMYHPTRNTAAGITYDVKKIAHTLK